MGCTDPLHNSDPIKQNKNNSCPFTDTNVPQFNFKNDNQTASIISQDIDLDNPIVKKYAISQIKMDNAGKYNISQVCDIWDSTNKRWNYCPYPDEYVYYKKTSDIINNNLLLTRSPHRSPNNLFS